MKKLLILFLFLTMAIPAYCADEWLKTRPASTDAKIDWPDASQANNEAIDRVLSNYREGLKLTYSSGSTLVITAGEVVCSNSTGTTRKFRANTSSTNVTFSDIDTGSEASSTTYYVYAVADADAATVTFKISVSSSAPTGVTYYKKIGSFYNNSSSDIEQIANDNSNVSIGSGTIADGSTISLPTGYSQDQCDWIVSVGSISASDVQAKGLKTITFTASSSRVVSADITTQNWVDGATNYEFTGTANYIIICYK